MKTQIELIEYYSKQLEKVTSSHGFNSEYFSHAYYMLRGIEHGLSISEAAKYASKKVEQEHKEALDALE